MTGQRSFFLALVLGASVIPSAVARSERPPTPELVRAERAVSAALQAEADVYAGAELSTAQRLLSEARDAESRRRKRDVISLSAQAELEARLAEATAITERLRADVEARSLENVQLRRELLDGGQP